MGDTAIAARVGRHVRDGLLAGLLVMVPASITILIFLKLLAWGDNILGPWLWNALVRLSPDIFGGRKIPGLGLVTTLLLLYLIGTLTRFYLGRQLVALWEGFISRVPVFGTLNRAAKQILSTITSPGMKGLQRVVFVSVPPGTSYVIGFVTGETSAADGTRLTNVFVPTAPNPTSGFVLLVPPGELIETHISVEDGLKTVVSLGLITRADAAPSVSSSGATPEPRLRRGAAPGGA